MAPIVMLENLAGDVPASKSSTACKPDLSFLPVFNAVGGRPTERLGSRGSFTPGVQTFRGGRARDVPLNTDEIDRGTVLFVSSKLKPDMSGEARTNRIRPTERLGSRGSFTPGSKRFLGGAPCDVPLETTRSHGNVLFVSRTLKPDTSAEARNNVIGGRPTERLGSRGSFTPDARRWSGGTPRDIPLPRERDHGTVIFESSRCKPDLSMEGETNVFGGRVDERHGRMGSFEHGVVEVAGGPLYMPPRDCAVQWREAGQKPENWFRRGVPGHFVAGISILSGGPPLY